MKLNAFTLKNVILFLKLNVVYMTTVYSMRPENIFTIHWEYNIIQNN